MPSEAHELARQLARRALDVCTRYLSKGQRDGRYWTVGDIANNPGRSLYVRLAGPDHGRGAAGHWADAATGEHGDLLDLIGLACGCAGLPETLEAARRLLALPAVEAMAKGRPQDPSRHAEAARRLFAAGHPIRGTLAERYLAARGIVGLQPKALRFHPRVYYRPTREGPAEARPALLAAVTNLDGEIVGVQRTWLDPGGLAKADVPAPRRALGDLLGHGVRIGRPDEVLAAGEGVETMLSLVRALPCLPVVAALSANHLSAMKLPSAVRRLYIARDQDAAGVRAAQRLRERVGDGVEVLDLLPQRGDFNDDLMTDGPSGVRATLRPQMSAEDLARSA